MTTPRRFTNPFQQPGTALTPSRFQNPFAASATPAARPSRFQNPFASGSAFDQPFAQTPTGAAIAPVLVSGLNTVGKVLQPFQAPQQVLFGGLGELTGDRGALGRGLSAGAGYLTYGATEYLPGQKGSRSRAVTGRALFRNLGAPEWAQNVGGVLADVFLDPTNILGGAGALAKAGGAARTGQTLVNAAEVVGRIGPFGVPVRDAFRALPAGTREALARTSYRFVYGAEMPVGMFPGMRAVTGVSRASALETFVPPTIATRLAPAEEAKRIAFQDDVRKRSMRLLEEYGRRRDTALEAWDAASSALPRAAREQLDRIGSRLTDAPDRAAFLRARDDLRALGTANADPGLERRALKALGASMAFDLWSGQNLVKVGKLSDEELLRNAAFPGGKLNPNDDRRGLRRLFATFGEDADAHIARVLADNKPARVEVDRSRLESTIARAFQPPAPGSPLPLIDLDLRAGSSDALTPGAQVTWSLYDGRRVRGVIGENGEINRKPYAGPRPGKDNLSRVDEGETIARGKRALLSRLDLEVRKGGLEPDVAKAAREFARMLPDEYLAGVGTTFRNVDAIDAGAGPGLGFYDPATAIVGIAKLGVNASRIGDRTVVHELAHHLEAFVPTADRTAMRGLYEREAARNAGRTTGNAGYRYTNFQEWFAENITDRAMRDIYPEGPARSLFERVARVIRDASVSVYNFFLRGGRRDAAQAVYKNLLAGRYDPAARADAGGDPLALIDRAKATPADVARTMEAFAQSRIKANTPTTLGDALADAARTHNLSAQEVADIAAAITSTRRSGAVEYQSAYQTAERLRARRNLEPTGNGPGAGPAAVGASKVSAREDLSERILQDYGQIESVFAQLSSQAQVVGQVVTRKQALLEMRQFAEAEGLLYSRLTQRAAAGQVDPVALPSAVVNRPEDPAFFKTGGGWRTVTAKQAEGLDGTFEAGDVVPDWLHRALTVGSAARDGLGLPVTYRRLLTLWKATKLGNPGTIVQNIVSNIIMADQYGINPAQQLVGMSDYLRRTPAQTDELRRAGIGGISQVDTEVRLETQRILAAQAGKKGVARLSGLVEAAFSFAEESTGARPGALPTGTARFIARLNPGRSLLALNGMTDELVRGSVYFASRRAGKSAAEAADISENVILDYLARPLAVEFASRSGIAPFATYQALSTWRLLENLYDRPFKLVRPYRAADSVARTYGEQDPERQRRELRAAPDYVREKLPIPLFKDDEGRTYYAPLSAFLPEGSATDIIDDVNSTNVFGVIPVPPAIGLYKQIFEGVGFRGQNIYKGLTDKGGIFEASKTDPVEAARRALKALYQFGAYPWAPGSPTTERLARAIAYAAKPEEGEPGALQTQILRFLKEGPFGYADGSLSVRGDTKYGEPPITLPMAVARSVLGVKAYPVQGEMSQVGAANWKVQGAQRELADLTSRYRDLIAKANPVDRPRLRAEAKAALEKKAQEVRALVQGLR